MDRFLELSDLSDRVNSSSFRVCKLARGATNDWRGDPVPFVATNLAQGMSVKDFFYSLAPARTAGYAKIAATPKAGYLTRRLVNLLRDYTYAELPCGNTTEIGFLCESGATSICSRCAGLYAKRDAGVAIGVQAAESFGEISTQSSMKIKHAVGSTTDHVSAMFGNIDDIFEVRGDIKERLAESDGSLIQKRQWYRTQLLELLPVYGAYADILIKALHDDDQALRGCTEAINSRTNISNMLGLGVVRNKLLQALKTEPVVENTTQTEVLMVGGLIRQIPR